MVALDAACVSTELSVCAVAGLASSHTCPFVRIAYTLEPTPGKSKTNKGSERVPVVVETGAADAVQRDRWTYTARWRTASASGSHVPCSELSSTFWIPAAVSVVDIQVWNEFQDGLNVFLGHAVVRVDDNAAKACRDQEILYPLETTKQHGLVSRLQLSVQLSMKRVYDERVRRVQERKDRRQEELNDNGPSVVDPAFAFTTPHLPIEWNDVVGVNLRHIFVRGDVEQLAMFQDTVLYGDVAREVDAGLDGIVAAPDHVHAFTLCQLSAQYVEHCVRTLAARSDDYREQQHVLQRTKQQLRRKRKQLREQQRSLQKQLRDLSVLADTYQRVLELRGGVASTDTPPQQSEVIGSVDSPSRRRSVSEIDSPKSPTSPPSTSPGYASKKPTFLMTYEERERERQLQKALSKQQRIGEEQQRLQQLRSERLARETETELLATAQQLRERYCARRLQRFVRRRWRQRILAAQSKQHHVAVRIQSVLRRFVCLRRYPDLKEQGRAMRETQGMQQSEQETRVYQRAVLALAADQAAAAARDMLSEIQLDTMTTTSGQPSQRPEVNALVAAWRRLHRIFVLALTTGRLTHAQLFAQLDQRRDGVLDRAELRTGIRLFGVRMARPLTRALVSLVRRKAGLPSLPLQLTLEQFVVGFDLPEERTPTPREGNDDDGDDDGTAPGSARSRSSRRTTPRENGDDDGKNDDEAAEEEAGAQAEAVAQAVTLLRTRILEAATEHLAARGQSQGDYQAFRAALTHVFNEFDTDGNGELDVHELVTCMSAINFHVTPANLSILRECFECDQKSDTVSITEFISFALARPAEGEEELGLLGFRLRAAILSRVRKAHEQTETLDDAVRLVFRAAYPHKAQTTCSRGAFVRVLVGLRLGVSSAQLGRLIARLDQDGDGTISFDELLVWLRLRTNDLPTRRESFHSMVHARRASLTKASCIAKLSRAVLAELAGLPVPSLVGAKTPSVPVLNRKRAFTQLFQRIDDNNSKQIATDELEAFLRDQHIENSKALSSADDTLSLLDVAAWTHTEAPPAIAARVASMTMRVMDLNGNGVVTLDEWLEFLLQDDLLQEEAFVMVDKVRALLRRAIHDDEQELLQWFAGIPGALHERQHVQVRVREFKNAVRQQQGSQVTTTELDQAVRRLDADRSGWITDDELTRWIFPARDLEEVLRVVKQRWQHERRQHANESMDAWALRLYSLFDGDGNGFIAAKEVQAGFAVLRVPLRTEEVQLLIKAFDIDQDGCLSKPEFLSCVYKLFPHEIFAATTTAAAQEQDEASAAYDDDFLGHSPKGSQASGSEPDNSGDESYSEVGSFVSVSLGPSTAVKKPSANIGTTIAEYSEDFD
ncbi:TPA: hypothetical protein N0F65_010490 [Lagenidium giganteum]|uniref:EF-hand domain-containing protein n=1 Tax=Lagenidium giganteum TaxID=4803 RepID=A0AAV2Z9X0_9STRA|nr:TPA: hypothetical protein N0F65_010490 [Lagenidium giganteum]